MGERTGWLESLEQLIVRDSNMVFTATSFGMILVILINQIVVFSIALGAAASVPFFLINVVFLGNAFFEDEAMLVRFLLGGLVLLVFVGVTSWLFLIAHSLDVWMSTLALCVVAGGCSLLSRLRKSVKR